MFCGGCGAPIVNGDQFCSTCGRPSALGPPRDSTISRRVAPSAHDRERNGGAWAAVVVAVIIAGGVAAWAAVSRGDEDGVSSIATSAAPTTVVQRPTSPPTTRAVTEAEAAALLGAFTVEVVPYRVEVDYYGAEVACMAVSAMNVSPTDAAPQSFEFTMVTPTGQIEPETFFMDAAGMNDPTWDMFPIVTPGAISNTVWCFPTNGERGEFVVRYQPLARSGDAWTVTI